MIEWYVCTLGVIYKWEVMCILSWYCLYLNTIKKWEVKYIFFMCYKFCEWIVLIHNDNIELKQIKKTIRLFW